MQDLKDVHAKMQLKKKERRELVKMFKDELAHNGEYQELVKELATLREKKRSIEDQAKANAMSDARQLEEIGAEIKAGNEMLADIALTRFLERKEVEIVDENDTRWVPVFSVRFKKEEGESYQRQAEAARAESHPERTVVPA